MKAAVRGEIRQGNSPYWELGKAYADALSSAEQLDGVCVHFMPCTEIRVQVRELVLSLQDYSFSSQDNQRPQAQVRLEIAAFVKDTSDAANPVEQADALIYTAIQLMYSHQGHIKQTNRHGNVRLVHCDWTQQYESSSVGEARAYFSITTRD